MFPARSLHSLARPTFKVDAGVRSNGLWGAPLLPASVPRSFVADFRHQAFRLKSSDTSRPTHHSYRPKISSDFVVKAEQRGKSVTARVRKTNQAAGVVDVAARIRDLHAQCPSCVLYCAPWPSARMCALVLEEEPAQRNNEK